jgi:hypothetical protein
VSKIKTPLTWGDALEMAVSVRWGWKDQKTNRALLEATGALPTIEKETLERIVRALMAVDVASRTQAREDAASGVSPIGKPISERACARCSAPDAAMEVRDHELGAALFFCSIVCVFSYPAADWGAWVTDALAPPVDHPFVACPEQGPCLAGLGKNACHDLADGRPCGKASEIHVPAPRQAALGAVEEGR